jgi:hypothetical protein
MYVWTWGGAGIGHAAIVCPKVKGKYTVEEEKGGAEWGEGKRRREIAMNKGGEIKEQCQAIVKILLLVNLLFLLLF